MKLATGSIVLAMLFSARSVLAGEFNFQEQSGKRGCASIITERGQAECARAQAAKDEACRRPVSCDVERQQKTIAEYEEATKRLSEGKVADADKAQLESLVRRLRDDLDARRAAAREGTSIAATCVRAREDVQKWFMETGIPLTERTRNDALQLRKELLEKLEEAKRKLTPVKERRDKLREEGKSDSDLDREHERLVAALREAEAALTAFNGKYGDDIERHAERLIKHYQAERDDHQRPLEEARNRVEKCKKVDNMSY